MNRNYTFGIFSFAAGIIVVFLLLYGALQLFHVQAGNILDWVIGVGSLIWLMIIVLVPWNIYFEALEVIQESKQSEKRNIDFDASQLNYVQKLKKGALLVALALHLISAVGLYAVSWAEISVVGYYGSGAAILLTILRPTIRAYEYISYRLSNIKQEVLYPREDLETLRQEFWEIKDNLTTLTNYFDHAEPNSWINQQRKLQQDLGYRISSLEKSLTALDKKNEEDHLKLTKETRHAIAQLSEDGKFIDNIVEIIRFIKKV